MDSARVHGCMKSSKEDTCVACVSRHQISTHRMNFAKLQRHQDPPTCRGNLHGGHSLALS